MPHVNCRDGLKRGARHLPDETTIGAAGGRLGHRVRCIVASRQARHVSTIERDLAALFGGSAVRAGDAARPYLHDSTDMQGLGGWADAVVIPQHVDEVAELVAWCYERGVSLVPRGGGTGLAGGAVPFGGVVCSLETLNRVRSFEPELWRAEVEAGVVTGHVHQLVRGSGLFYPPDPGASAQSQIGGNVACNAGGPHSFKYGTTGAWVTGVEAVVGGGRVVRFGGSFRKDVAGYDVRSLLVGSEGTLGIITRAWLRLIPAPERAIPIVASYASLSDGVAALRRVLGSGLLPSMLEYFDRGTVRAAAAGFPGTLADNAAFVVLTEADGSEAEATRLAVDLDEALAEGALAVTRLESRAEMAALQRWRSGVSYAVSAQRGGKMSEDIAVPFDALEEALAGIEQIGRRIGVESCSWGHAGDGNLHATFLIDATSAEDVSRAEGGAVELFELTLRLGGTVTGEHGLGWVKREQLIRQFGPVEVELQRGIKDLFDPKHLFNPGKKGFDRATPLLEEPGPGSAA
jgi:glycolate oxidase subunit GlcD